MSYLIFKELAQAQKAKPNRNCSKILQKHKDIDAYVNKFRNQIDDSLKKIDQDFKSQYRHYLQQTKSQVLQIKEQSFKNQQALADTFNKQIYLRGYNQSLKRNQLQLYRQIQVQTQTIKALKRSLVELQDSATFYREKYRSISVRSRKASPKKVRQFFNN